MYAVSIDAGGTMTDAIVRTERGVVTLKVDSTPHDLTVSLMNCLTEAAQRLDYATAEDFLLDVNLIRWSSTVASNVLGELKGAKIGIVVARGSEQTLYGAERSPAVGSIVPEENIFGIDRGIAGPELLHAVKSMLRRGVRRICVCLPGSFPDNAEERRVKSLITEQYPDHFVGSVPVILGSEIIQTPDDQTRAHHALINAYVHPPLAASLFKCEDRLKDEGGWNGPLLIGHTDGGVARVGKTRAIDTIESGPVFGLFGAASFAARYGERLVLCLDVGGTTTKASIARDGEPVFWRSGDFFGIPTTDPIALLRSCSIGGGSVAAAGGADGGLTVGPASMGAAPGPACYGLGGTHATLTDAFLILGYLDPAAFHGGRRRLDSGLAARAIERAVATPCGMSMETAALAIRDRAVATVAALVAETAAKAGENVSDTTLFAIGGNGPLFAPFIAEKLGIGRVYVFFALGPVFSAYGCDTSDVVHTYRKGVAVHLGEALAAAVLEATLEELRARAAMDLAGEGFDPALATYATEFEVEGPAGDTARVVIENYAAGDGDLCARIGSGYAGGVAPASLKTALVGLRARYTLPAVPAAQVSDRGADGGAAVVETQTILLSGDPVAAPVYDWTHLAAGQRIEGPVLIRGGDTTCVVPGGWRLTVDRFDNGVMTRL